MSKEEKFMNVMGNIRDEFIEESKPCSTAKKKKSTFKWIGMAACFCLIVASFIGIKSGLIVPKVQTATLSSGDTVSFYKSPVSAGSLDMDVNIKKLSQNKINKALNSLNIDANGYYSNADGTFMGLEGKLGESKIFISKPNVNIRDSIVVGEEKLSTVKGVDVKAGYFVTKANSKGIKTEIYYAEIKLDNCTVYLENAGEQGSNTKDKLVLSIEEIFDNIPFNLSVFEN